MCDRAGQCLPAHPLSNPPFPPTYPSRWLLTHTHVILSWIFNLSYSLGLVYCSTWLVVNIAPEAAGAGVAEVSAYLNGCNIPKVRSWRGSARGRMVNVHTQEKGIAQGLSCRLQG